MTPVSVRDLRYGFHRVEALLRQGEDIQIANRGKVVARLVPQKIEYPPLPVFAARIREIYGDKVFEISGADLLSAERDRW